MPRNDLAGKPAASTNIVYSPMGSSEIEYSPRALLCTDRCCEVATLVTVMVAPLTAAALGSSTVPNRRAVDCCAYKGEVATRHSTTKLRMGPSLRGSES